MDCRIQNSKEEKTCYFKKGLPDSGATHSLIGLDLAKKFNLNINLEDKDHVLGNASSERMSVTGSAEIYLRARGTGNTKRIVTLVS